MFIKKLLEKIMAKKKKEFLQEIAPEGEEEINEIETTIAAVSGTYGTGYTIRTAEGAVWRISDVPRRLLEPKAGDKLTIKSGALSAYYLRIGDQSGVKGSRVR